MREFVVTYRLRVPGGSTSQEEIFSPVVPPSFIKYDRESPFRLYTDEQTAEDAARRHLAYVLTGKGKWVSYEHEHDEPRLYVREVTEWVSCPPRMNHDHVCRKHHVDERGY